jgi:hypothetical protein
MTQEQVNEGEFKKRNANLVIQSRLYHWFEIRKIQQLFDDWSDEAKKEFPKLTNHVVEGKDYSPEKMLLCCESWHREIREWFRKWFGDAV